MPRSLSELTLLENRCVIPRPRGDAGRLAGWRPTPILKCASRAVALSLTFGDAVTVAASALRPQIRLGLEA